MSSSSSHSSKKELSGVIGFVDGPDELLEAMKKVRATYENVDAYSPFPIHGMDDAQRLKRSKIPIVAFFAGITGTTAGFTLQYWTSAVDWKVNVGGKPFNSWPAFVPVMFELTILFAGISLLVSMLLLNRLPNIKRKIPDPSLTKDRFAIFIENVKSKNAGSKQFEEAEATQFLNQMGAKDVRPIYAESWF